MARQRKRVATIVGATSVALIAGGITTWALAKPATAVMYPEGASATRFIGLAFDTCAAPKREVMSAWKANSPYGAIGIYISGGNRACKQQELDNGWVKDTTAMGWKLLPLDVGLQAPCADRTRHPMSRNLDTAYQQGRKAASGALKRAAVLGIQPGSAIYSDIESFDSRDSGCADAVRSYISGWTFRLHRNGYLAGAYGNQASLIERLSQSHNAERYVRPDVVWNANWDRTTALTGWDGIPDHHWANSQRVKQYLGDHTESYGDYTLNIDTNALDAPVATVFQTFTMTGSAAQQLYSGPSTARPAAGTLNPGDAVNINCQIGTPTGKWNKRPDGTWIPDSATSNGAVKPFVPPCSVPYQVATDGAWVRTGPGTEYLEVKPLPAGSLAFLQCETPGTTLDRPGYWASIAGGGWVSGALLARPNIFQRSVGVPACELPPASALSVTPLPSGVPTPVPLPSTAT